MIRKNILVAVGFAATVMLLPACSPPAPSTPQAETKSTVSVTEDDYRRAEAMLSPNTTTLVQNTILSQYWQSDGRLIYRKSIIDGSEYLLFDPESGSKQLLFDDERLAEGLREFVEDEIEANNLVLSRVRLDDSSSDLQFRFQGDTYHLDLASYELQQLEETPSGENLSPDGSKAVFIENYNLWVRDTTTNTLTQLTSDGIEDYGYGTNNAGWVRSDTPVLKWSPDSRKIATFRHDGRNVQDMILWSTEVGHPQPDIWKYPLVGDEHIFMIERLVIHLEETPRLVWLDMPQDSHRSTSSDHVAGQGSVFLDVQWSKDSQELSFISSSRDHKIADLRIADVDTGEVSDVYREVAETHYMTGFNTNNIANVYRQESRTHIQAGFIDENWRVLHERGEFIWFSEKDNWGHLYLHDLESGELISSLTEGPWLVVQIHRIDLENEQLYFLASNVEGRDPYFYHMYRVNLDGTSLELLTPEDAHHAISWSVEGDYFVDTYSTPDTAPVSVLRNIDGEIVAELEEGDSSALLAAGWVPPVPFTVKARDQVTNLYGLLYKPSNFDLARSYPVLNYLYPGPLGSSVGSRRFLASRADKQAVAELGFIVVEVDAMGTPGRSKSFQDIYYGNMGDNGLPDQITTIRQLASTRPWMDIDRVGIWGHSGGGFASTAGILRYPEFYKVAVSSAGNHDNRNYEDDWAERFQGLLETYPETDPVTEAEVSVASTNYDNQANQLLVENLQGKLLLAHGLMDTNVHPSSTLLVVDALIKADKDFDLFIFPNRSHGFVTQRYFMNKRWDYFVEHLIGSEPPEYTFGDNIR